MPDTTPPPESRPELPPEPTPEPTPESKPESGPESGPEFPDPKAADPATPTLHPALHPALHQEPAADIARRVARELQQLSSITARIECAVSGLMLDSPGMAKGLHHDLQSLDSLGQMLEALAQFLTDMATQIPQDWKFDPTNAAASVKLKDLAQRLGNQNSKNTKIDKNNECEFF